MTKKQLKDIFADAAVEFGSVTSPIKVMIGYAFSDNAYTTFPNGEEFTTWLAEQQVKYVPKRFLKLTNPELRYIATDTIEDILIRTM